MNRWAFLLLSPLIFSTLSCGDKKADATLTVVPDSPIVFDTPFTRTNADGTTVNFAANWFQAKINVTNNLDEKIVISSLKYTVRYRTDDGTVVTDDEKSYSESGCFILNIIEPGKSEFLGKSADGGAAGSCVQFTEVFIPSLPKSDGNRYRVQFRLEGWVGEPDAPTRRLTSDQVSFNIR